MKLGMGLITFLPPYIWKVRKTFIEQFRMIIWCPGSIDEKKRHAAIENGGEQRYETDRLPARHSSIGRRVEYSAVI
jgi:hypothetical protein